MRLGVRAIVLTLAFVSVEMKTESRCWFDDLKSRSQSRLQRVDAESWRSRAGGSKVWCCSYAWRPSPKDSQSFVTRGRLGTSCSKAHARQTQAHTCVNAARHRAEPCAAIFGFFAENLNLERWETARCEWLCSYAEIYASHLTNQPLRASDQWKAYN